jgi:hypothetical protein
MMCLQIGLLNMKEPRFDYFATKEEHKKIIKPLHSPLDNMPPIISPADVKKEPQKVNVHKSTSRQVDKSTSGQVDKSTNPQMDKSTSPQVDKAYRRFTTYYKEESIKAMKRLALEGDKKDYELFQEAVEKYLKKKGY